MRRVVITGLGVVAPNGIGKDSFWSACTNGRSGVGPIKSFDASAHPVKVAAEVTGFDAYPYIPNGQRKNLKVMSRAMQFAVGAAGMAVEDSGLELSKEDPERLGVVMGTGIVPMDLTELAPALAEAYDGNGHLQTTKLARRGKRRHRSGTIFPDGSDRQGLPRFRHSQNNSYQSQCRCDGKMAVQ